ncbi:YbaB/EbfC family nucleoid-associated protein [Actinopolymorpha alba]|uniref:YbaB/EbfC family nucleoid-associated protein n=1 Tax=Actinopolymorpha alba TaxID=533267 RepID=UPI0003667FD8|nr:YbaB/EbfC family nucleoid-associated protein [Actinopolymorpha alba]
MSTDEYEELLNAATRQMEAAQSAADQFASLRGVGEAADGRVRVEVMAGGSVQGLELDPRVMRMPSEDLAAAVLEAIHAATSDASEKLAEIFDTALPGAGSALAGLIDPAGMANGTEATQTSVDEIVESLRRTLQEGR